MRSTFHRLSRLQTKRRGSGFRRCHVIHGENHAEADAKRAAMVAAGEASEEDPFIHLIFVDPPPTPGAYR
jgi:hypothetical protein